MDPAGLQPVTPEFEIRKEAVDAVASILDHNPFAVPDYSEYGGPGFTNGLDKDGNTIMVPPTPRDVYVPYGEGDKPAFWENDGIHPVVVHELPPPNLVPPYFDGAPPSDSDDTDSTFSKDPNEKTGPSGYGDQHFVMADSTLAYRINFENDATAPGAAQRIDITDRLDPLFDWSTLQLTEVGFGDVLIPIPAGSQFFRTTVPYRVNDVDFQVEIEVGLRPGTGELYAQFLAIDPATGLPPTANVGILAPEDGTGRGQGFFSYTIRPDAGLASGTAIRNVALIQFDRGEIIATNQIDPHDPGQGTSPDREAFVTIDAGLPSSSVDDLPSHVAAASFLVSWTGIDDVGGAGVAYYDIYVSTDGGPFQPFLSRTPETSAVFTGEPGRTYAFYSVATDGVGHREPTPGGSQTQTTTGDLVLTISGATEVAEGQAYVLTLASSGSGADTISGWTIHWGDGSTQAINGNPSSASHTFVDGFLAANIRASATLDSGTLDANMLDVSVRNVDPTVDAGADATVVAGGTFFGGGSFLDPGELDTFTATVDYGDGTGSKDLTLNANHTFDLSHTYATSGSFTVTVSIRDDDGGIGQDTLTITVNEATPRLGVESLSATPSGVIVRFTQTIDPSTLNLYGTQTGGLGPADLVLFDPQGNPVRGSLVVSQDRRSVNFVKTGGVLAPGTYSLILRGADNGFRNTGGEALDGDGDQQPGGDFTGTVQVTAASARVISLPDFARGPGQTVDVPATAGGLPLKISDGTGVLSVDLRWSMTRPC